MKKTYKSDEFRLTTTRLELRPVLLSDVTQDYLDWMNDALINQHMETRFRPQEKGNVEQYVRDMRINENVLFLAILLKDDKRHIGNIKLEIAPIHQRGEISLWIGDRETWGRGLATDAICCISNFGLHELRLAKLTAGCYSCNIASARAFIKAGFEQEAVLKKQYVCDGHRVDRYCFALLNRGE